MKLPRLRTLLLAPILLFALFSVGAAITPALTKEPADPAKALPARHETIAKFGASGTAGDGILKAALAAPGIRKIHVVTRRATPRIEEGVASGKVQMTLHEAHLGQRMLYGFFAPVGAAVKATQIGQAMIEVTARGEEFGNGDILGTRKIIRYSDAYGRRPR